MHEKSAILQALQETELFTGIADETLNAIADITVRRNYEEGDSVYQLGDDAGEVFLVASGRVRFSLGAGNRPGTAASIMTAGQAFGWAALLEDQPRRVATASCLENSSVLAVDGVALQTIFAQHTEAGYLVMRRLAGMIARNFMDVLSN